MKRSRRRTQKKLNKYVLICAFIAILAILIAATGMFVQAQEKNEVLYTSIEIQDNDTLWAIASTYCDPDEESITEYIENIKEINNISSDQIISGNYLIIYEYQ